MTQALCRAQIKYFLEIGNKSLYVDQYSDQSLEQIYRFMIFMIFVSEFHYGEFSFIKNLWISTEIGILVDSENGNFPLFMLDENVLR